MEGAVRDIKQTVNALQKGDLACEPQTVSRDEMGQIAGSLKAAMGQLREDIRAIGAISDLARKRGPQSGPSF